MSSPLPILSNKNSGNKFPTRDALDAIWKEVAMKPLWAPPNFWRYLKLRWRMKLKLLNPTKLKIHAPGGKVNHCQSCTNNCCIGTESTVLLRLYDIATLIDLEKTDLICQEKPGFNDAMLTQRPALRKHVASKAWEIFPVLEKNSFGACAALTSEGACSLYPEWPLSCSRFPYSLNLDASHIFYSRRCDSFWIRSDVQPQIEAMRVAAVACYNERIKDAILLEYAPKRLAELGLLRYLNLGENNAAS